MPISLKVLLLSIITIILFSCRGTVNDTPAVMTENADSSLLKGSDPGEFMYGIPPDSFDLISGEVKRNGFLSEILIKYGISMEDIDRLVRNSADVFDVRKLRS